MQRLVSVSVITPAYNAEKYIAESIESILNQTFRDFEFIIVDDCSTDGTWEIIQAYARKDARIMAVKNEENLGIAKNRNKGVAMAHGEYIVWQDADDRSVPDRIEKQLAFLKTHPRVGIVGGFLRFFNESGPCGIRKYSAEDSELRKRIFRYSPVAQPAAMLRKRCLDESGPYLYSLAEDIEMSFRLGERYEFANLQEVVLEYREHPKSATFTRLKSLELGTLEIRKKYAVGHGYHMSFFDRVYNILQFVSIFIVPPRIKIWLFDKLRNSK